MHNLLIYEQTVVIAVSGCPVVLISVHSQDYYTSQQFEAVQSNNHEAAKQQIPELILNIGHSAKVTKLVLSPDGTRLLSATEDNTVKLWDVQSGREIRSYSIGRLVHSISWCPDNKTFMAENIQIDIENGSIISHLGGFSGKTINRIVGLPAEREVLGISDSCEIILWDLIAGKILNKYYNDEYISELAISGGGLQFACGTINGSVFIYKINEIDPVHIFKLCNSVIG